MYPLLIFLHSIVRWLVLTTLLLSIFRAFRGYFGRLPFTLPDDRFRHWTATMAHIQLMLGMVLYTQSPFTGIFKGGSKETMFYSVIHITLMFTAIILITIGSSLAKRKPDSHTKFRVMMIWFTIALCIIILAIPWPFSPLSGRPLLRAY